LKISVCLIAHTPFPDRCVAQAARLCYSRGTAAERFAEDLEDSQVEIFLEKLSRSGHLSPFEHVSFSFGVDHISRVCSHQLVRHRLASYSQQSQRYVPMEISSVVCPPTVQAHQEAREIFEKAQREAHEAYRNLCSLGIPREDARYLLPHGFETSLVLTMNAREMMHFFSLRLCRRAQWEIQNVAKEMLRLARVEAPHIFATAGPSCISKGSCEEERPCGNPYQSMEELLEE